MEFKACLINADKRYDNKNIAEVDWLANSQTISLLRGDKRFVQLLVSSQNTADCTVQISGAQNGITTIVHAIGDTLAFIGHAGWYARNPKGILPTGPKVNVGDVLQNCSSLSVPQGGAASFYLEITTANDAVCGDTCLTISVLSGGNKQVELKLTVDVLDMQMPSVQEYTFKPEYWQYPFSSADYYGVEDFSQEHMDILRKQQEFYRDLGGSAVVASIVEEAWGGQTYSSKSVKYPSMIKWLQNDSRKMTYDYTIFDKWIKLNQEVGLGDKIICYSIMSWGNFITYTDKSGAIKRIKAAPSNMFRYRKYWLHFLHDFTVHLDELGIFEQVYMGFDERSNMLGVLKLLATVKNKDGKTFKTSAAFNHFMTNKKCFDLLDRASVGLDEARDNVVEFNEAAVARENTMRETSIYTATDNYPNSFALSMPCESYWTILFAYSCGANGFLRWAYDAWVKDPLADTTHCSFPAGDCFLIYPSPKDSKNRQPLWSTRLVRLDDGVRDVNILAAIKQHANAEILKRIDKLLSSIKPNYTQKVLQDKSWGVSIMRAQWADDMAAKAIPADMATAKQEVISIINDFISSCKLTVNDQARKDNKSM